jgi:hypothetical protein
MRFSIDHLDVERTNTALAPDEAQDIADIEGQAVESVQVNAALTMHVIGKRPVGLLVAILTSLESVFRVWIVGKRRCARLGSFS